MDSNILFLPFRKSHSVNLTEAIKQYISSKYDQHPDMFKDDLESVEKLRSTAIHAQEPHPSNVTKLQQYAAQLVWLSGKFPVDVGVEFPWYPALHAQLFGDVQPVDLVVPPQTVGSVDNFE